MNVFSRTIQEVSGSRAGLVVALSLSAILRSLLLILEVDTPVNSDGVLYLAAARQFSMGHFSEGFATYTIPLYPLLLSFVHLFVPDWVLAGRLISCTCVVLVLIPLYMLTNDLFDRKAAFWSCIMFVLSPESLRLTTPLIRDPPFVLSFMWTVYLAQKTLQSRRVVHLLATASLSWFSMFLRLEGLIIFPIYLLTLIILALVKRERRKSFLQLSFTWIIFSVLLFTVTVVIMGPQSLALSRYTEYGTHVENLLGFNLFENLNRISAQLQHMEDASPYARWGKSFAKTAREFMAVIYMLGLVGMLVEVLVPTNIIPLIWGLKKSLSWDRHIFLLILAVSYLLAIYYFFVYNDFLLRRFLFVPSVLLYPWIGIGIERILDFARKLSHSRLVIISFMLLMLVIPSHKLVRQVQKSDDLEMRAGAWLGAQQEFRNMKIISTDPRVAFYTGREVSYKENGDTQLYLKATEKNYEGIEQVAMENGIDLVVVSVLTEKRSLLPNFQPYKPVKEFVGRERSIIIYCSSRCWEKAKE
jgi:hypothetical protein